MILDPKLTKRQLMAFSQLNRLDVQDVLYGGAKGGGKTFLMCRFAFTWAKAIMADFQLQPTRTPLHIGFMGRKQSVDFTATTLQTWQEIIPESEYELKGATDKYPKHILINKTVAIDYGGFDRQENVNKFNSAEYVFICIDQAEELTQDDVSVLRASRRMKINGQEMKYKGLFTANPAPSWLRGEFITDPPKHNRFVQALPADNPHLPSSYVDMLTDAFKHRPELLRAYLHGDWDSMEGPTQMIKAAWLHAAKQRSVRPDPIHEYLVCDPAREGDDECVIFRMHDAEIVDKIILPFCKTVEISSRLARESKQNGNCMAVIESIGADLGAGVIDELGEHGVTTLQYNPAGKSSNSAKYYNLRAEAWDMAAKCLNTGIMPESNCLLSCRNMYQLLEEQLCTPTYKFRGERLLVEAKADIKKRLGRSPDHADAYVIALWAWSRIRTEADTRSRKLRSRELAEKYAGVW